MEAIILAGGFGTRLKDTVKDVAKPMAPVKGKPFLEYILQWLSANQVSKIIISAGYKAETIRDYFGNAFKGINLSYVIEKEPLGTGGAIKYALEQTSDKDLLVLNGDTWFPVNVRQFMSFHRESGAKISVALKRMTDFERYGTVEIDGVQIIRFNEKKKCADGLINGGIYIVNQDYIRSMILPGVFSFEKEILEKVTASGSLMGMSFDEVFIDIGIPEDYHKAGLFLIPGNYE